ncbi:MAG: hypothetical protein Greene041614_1016 [Parcubacteria group bacterium Greene0416_14]|nr:MAG: hypothetical protein Greene041614_1016 [Parcubacteria group bacterium Greene0416_14]
MNRAEYAALIGSLFVLPPLIMWLSLVVYLITDVNFFDQINTPNAATSVIFSQFLIVVGYPIGTIALGMIAKKNNDQVTVFWTRKAGKALIIIGINDQNSLRKLRILRKHIEIR